MQLGATPAENDKRWAAVPALAAISPLGPAKPGASVLAVTGGPGGAARALIAVQRFGDGRAMVFTGEASWRWRMMLPTSDQSYERFWRQAVRWLAQNAPEPVTIALPAAPAPAEAVPVTIAARDAGYTPRADAIVDIRVTAPSGRIETVPAVPVASQGGQFRASVRATEPGVYRISVDARQGQTSLGTSTGTMLVGGVDPEMSDPRVNEDTLQRGARASGGAVLTAGETSALLERLSAAAPAAVLALRRDLRHTGWSFGILAALLAAEWLTRRAWGLR